MSQQTTFSPLHYDIRLSLCRTSNIFLHLKKFVLHLTWSNFIKSTQKYMKILYPFWYCTLGLYIKKNHFFPFLQYPHETHFLLPSSPYISFPSPTLKDSASPSKRTSVSSFQSTVDSDSAASISLNVELDNVNFHIKKPSKYPHVPPHPADQKGRR